MKIRYCSFDGDPTVLVGTRAFAFRESVWVPIESAEVLMSARALNEAAFKKRFGELPPLPIASCRAGGSSADETTDG